MNTASGRDRPVDPTFIINVFGDAPKKKQLDLVHGWRQF
jgi:hypothetical protein